MALEPFENVDLQGISIPTIRYLNSYF